MRSFLPLLCVPVLMAAPSTPSNPLLDEWKTPFGAPPFDQIQPEHYLPAIEEAMARHKKEIEAIATNPATPTFANTVEALDDSGDLLSRIKAAFDAVNGAETNEKLQAVAKQITPKLSAHFDDISLDPRLFKRVKAVFDQKDKLKLKPEQDMLLRQTYRGFVRGGALLNETQQKRFRALNEELGLLSLQFGENLLKETNAYQLVLDRKEDLKGLPEALVAAAAETAKQKGQAGKWIFTFQAPSIRPFMQYAENRELRKRFYQAFWDRCDKGDATDNKGILAKIAALRVEKAQLLGFKTWAHFILDDRMAKVPENVNRLLDQLWKPSMETAKREMAELQKLADSEKAGIQLEAWDWAYYSEKLRKAKYDLDEEVLKPYFSLDHTREGVFLLAKKLYGLKFVHRKDVPTYHPEVQVYEVQESNGKHIGVIYLDYHPRPGKRGGAWCGGLQEQWIHQGKFVHPITTNVGNFARPVGSKPALLNFEEVETLFHEFGHALHGLLSQCRYRSLSGNNVAWDFVELPSQIMEQWVKEPEFLKLYARHYQTGQPIPDGLIQKIQKTAAFNQGYETARLVAASRLDMDWHTLTTTQAQDPAAFEKAAFERMGLISQVPPMHRTPAFRHIFSGGYSSGYYSYAWSAVLDADAYQAFVEKKNIFDPMTAKAFREHILSRGGSEDAAVLYKRFRGAEPKPAALLKQRGLLQMKQKP